MQPVNDSQRSRAAWGMQRTNVLNLVTGVTEGFTKVLEITGGRGVDHVIEVGGASTILQSVNAVRYGGSVNVIGFVAGVSTEFLVWISKRFFLGSRGRSGFSNLIPFFGAANRPGPEPVHWYSAR